MSEKESSQKNQKYKRKVEKRTDNFFYRSKPVRKEMRLMVGIGFLEGKGIQTLQKDLKSVKHIGSLLL